MMGGENCMSGPPSEIAYLSHHVMVSFRARFALDSDDDLDDSDGDAVIVSPWYSRIPTADFISGMLTLWIFHCYSHLSF
jgi:hypothetical protein